jgi:hypothetical protein
MARVFGAVLVAAVALYVVVDLIWDWRRWR